MLLVDKSGRFERQKLCFCSAKVVLLGFIMHKNSCKIEKKMTEKVTKKVMLTVLFLILLQYLQCVVMFLGAVFSEAYFIYSVFLVFFDVKIERNVGKIWQMMENS